MDFPFIFGLITAVGTAILTVAGVWRLLTGPLTKAIQGIEMVVQKLDARLTAHEATHDSDVKDIWMFLAQRKDEKT